MSKLNHQEGKVKEKATTNKIVKDGAQRDVKSKEEPLKRRAKLFTPSFGQAGLGEQEKKRSFDDSFIEFVEPQRAQQTINSERQRKEIEQKEREMLEKEQRHKMHLIARLKSPVESKEDRKSDMLRFTPSIKGSDASAEAQFIQFLRTPDMVKPRMPSLSAIQRRHSGLQYMFVDEAEADGNLQVTQQLLDFGEDWEDKQSELKIRDKVERQRLKAAVNSVKELNVQKLDYSTSADQILELLMPRVFIQSVVALEDLKLQETSRQFDFLQRNLQSDIDMTRKTQALKIQLILAQERNSKTKNVVQDALRKMQKKLKKIKGIIGIDVDTHRLNPKIQDVIYKDAFKAEVELSIEKFGGTITIKHIQAYVKYTVQNGLKQFATNPILRSQKYKIIQMVKRCAVNALKENGVREFRLGFFLGLKPLYDLMTDIAMISTLQFVSHFFVEDNFIHLGFEVYPLHREFQATIRIMIGISSKNKYTYELQSVKIDPLFNSQHVKLEQRVFQVRKETIKKQVMVPCRKKDDDWKWHDLKVILTDYYNTIKKKWSDVKEVSPYHLVLDFMLATEEIFYYED